MRRHGLLAIGRRYQSLYGKRNVNIAVFSYNICHFKEDR